MSEQAPEVTQGSVESQPDTSNTAPWSNYLTDLPDSVKPLVEPIFRQWDADTTKRFQSVHSEYESLKPYQEIVSAGWDYNDVQQAIQLAATLNDNPQAIYDALVENYGYGQEQGQEAQQIDEEEQVDPRFAQLEQMTNQMAEIMVAQQNEQTAKREDAELDTLLNSLKEEHGDYDEKFVLARMFAGDSPQEAVAAFQQAIGTYAANRPAPPVIMGSGGGLPSQTVNPASMSDRDRKALITQMLAQAAQT